MNSTSAVIVNYPEPYGPAPKTIRHTSNILVQNSIFVDFRNSSGKKTFQFEGGFKKHSFVFLDVTTGLHIIVANGAAYEFDANLEKIISQASVSVVGHKIIDGTQLIMWTDIEIMSYGSARWHTERLALDEITVLGREGNFLRCSAYDPINEKEAEFTISLIDGSDISGRQGYWS